MRYQFHPRFVPIAETVRWLEIILLTGGFDTAAVAAYSTTDLEWIMTYFGFLLRFLFIPILILLAITVWDNHKPIPGFRNGRAVWVAIGIHILLAVVYTTPWDNYLVATGVWYYNPTLVAGFMIGYVPIEEYTFFVGETILSGLWWWFLARRFALTPSPSPAGRGGFTPNKRLVYRSTCLLVSL